MQVLPPPIPCPLAVVIFDKKTVYITYVHNEEHKLRGCTQTQAHTFTWLPHPTLPNFQCNMILLSVFLFFLNPRLCMRALHRPLLVIVIVVVTLRVKGESVRLFFPLFVAASAASTLPPPQQPLMFLHFSLPIFNSISL
ncbi:hypothetical protein ECG_03192 [Echinococcus granulosus]|uniref:Expressed protein n=1 Tax=Echinococcus granulosus TaxID=6210 RepID=A0A068WQC5_ECHGR|nr:hypothetical protein ECG_03192 [Echinococcus granulosus]CDS19836.1 expressed protein [Echinococcus granulosus]